MRFVNINRNTEITRIDIIKLVNQIQETPSKIRDIIDPDLQDLVLSYFEDEQKHLLVLHILNNDNKAPSSNG